MIIALMIFFTAIGVILLLSPYYMGGVILMALTTLLWRCHTIEREERFIAFLAVLAFLGGVALLAEDFIGRWLLS